MYSLGFSKLPSLNSKMWESFWEATLQNERRFRIRKGNVPLYFSIVITKLDDVKIILRRQLYKITDFVMSDKNLRNFRNRPVWCNQISILTACLKNIEVKGLQCFYIILRLSTWFLVVRQMMGKKFFFLYSIIWMKHITLVESYFELQSGKNCGFCQSYTSIPSTINIWKKLLSTAIWADKNELVFGRIACISSKDLRSEKIYVAI